MTAVERKGTIFGGREYIIVAKPMLIPLWDSVFVLCFVVRYFVQSS